MDEIVRVENLAVHYPVRMGFLESMAGKERQYIRAVDGISFSIGRGEILSLVGESGCGKTTTGKAVLQLIGDHFVKGSVSFTGKNARGMKREDMRAFRQKAQMIFQDPYQSLNPKDTVYDIVAEPLEVNRLTSGSGEMYVRVKNALENAGLKPADDYMNRYPHELSGGQRQRVAIAGALVLEPLFVVADEPVSMLDVSIRADILKLICSHRDERGISYLFITHDLSLAWVISDRIAIMYLGKIMEIGPADEIIKRPVNPYSRALIEVMPRPEPRRGKKRAVLSGEAPDPENLPPGCRFHTRCPYAAARCREEEPSLKPVGENHLAACHLF